ncbi:MAG: ATP-binding cassette domain-containing protein [Luteitalea sp.]|nr:ATP-binding cassette domain-containing protein [Luteitalea sp.]
MPHNTSAQVVVRDLQKHYGGIQAARGVSLEVEQGETFGLLGPNGAGKTTTLECIIGLREPDEGYIEVCGVDARRRPRDAKQKIGAVLQTTALQDKITPHEALQLFGSLYRGRIEPGPLLEQFGLTGKADAAFDTLSRGQQQRLGLALAFVNKPELLFLDEPTTGLDPQSRRELHTMIARMKQDGHTVLLTTHYIDEAEQLCDRLAIIDHGRIIAEGTPRELIAHSTAATSIALETVQAIEATWLEQLSGVHDLTCEPTRARFRSTDIARTLAELMELLNARQVELAALHVQKATLEDVFLELTGTSLDNPGEPETDASPSAPSRPPRRGVPTEN